MPKELQVDSLRESAQTYFSRVQQTYHRGDASEMSYRTFFQNFIEKIAEGLIPKCQLTQESQKAEGIFGRPDFKARRGAVTVGYIETKDILSDLDEVLRTDQLKKYLSSINNMIITDYCRFILIRNGQKTELDIQLITSDKLREGDCTGLESKLSDLKRLIVEFFDYKLTFIRSAGTLAAELAKRSHLLKDLSKTQLEKDKLAEQIGEPTSAVYEFLKVMKKLIPDISLDDCADAYAQTISYGLFLGRYYSVQLGNTTKGVPITRTNAASFIPQNIGLIRKILLNVGADLPSDLAWIVEEILDVLNSTDVQVTLSDVVERTGHRAEKEKEAFLVFYEDFLTEYDPRKRKELGVYYTPRQIASFIVKSIEDILKRDFGKVDGFASNDVTVLDPATGTGTFLNLAYLRAILELKNSGRRGMIEGMIRSHILKDFYGFELLMPAYVLAHLKLSRQLSTWNYGLQVNERAQVYLTNTLDDPEENNITTLDAFMKEISQEARVAGEVKRKPILVILGNPPYNKRSYNRSPWILRQIRTYKQDLTERRLGNLDDDYVKFFRFGQWKIDGNPDGILGFVSNNSFLSDTTFRSMRKSLFGTFNYLYILNLHGDTNLHELTPEGEADENVFNIKQGVTISLFFKKQGSKEHRLFYFDLWGKRETKLLWLDRFSLSSVKWRELHPEQEYCLFSPSSLDAITEYNTFFPIDQIFEEFNSGIETKKDKFLVNTTKEELIQKMKVFSNMSLSDGEVKNRLSIEDIEIGTDKKGKPLFEWRVEEARKTIEREGILPDLCVPYLYRPFDYRWIYFSEDLVSRCRRPEADLMLDGSNESICVSRLTKARRFSSALAADSIIDLKYCEYSRGVYFFPMFKGGKISNNGIRQSNFTSEFMAHIKGILGSQLTDEMIFHYIYGVLFSPSYRERYNDRLRIDFPRIPITQDIEKFRQLSQFGKELLDLHLMRAVRNVTTNFDVEGSNKVDFVRYRDEKAFINESQYFEPITKDVWAYDVGNYLVLDKWLKGRKGRRLDNAEIEHFRQMVEVIKRTFEITKKIDDIDILPKV